MMNLLHLKTSKECSSNSRRKPYLKSTFFFIWIQFPHHFNMTLSFELRLFSIINVPGKDRPELLINLA